jgi:hypothetical protein
MKRRTTAIFLMCLGAQMSVAHTTKGLNQIVTPDIQPIGQFSLSAQVQHQIIGNSEQIQYELGIVKNFEVAAFQGLKPGGASLAAELGLLQKGPLLISTGFLGWSTAGDKPQPFLVGGYYKGPVKVVVGVQSTNDTSCNMGGCAYQVNPKLLVQADYLSGSVNYTTFGFTFSPNSALSINPAIYLANSSDHRAYPYLVVSYTVQAFKG